MFKHSLNSAPSTKNHAHNVEHHFLRKDPQFWALVWLSQPKPNIKSAPDVLHWNGISKPSSFPIYTILLSSLFNLKFTNHWTALATGPLQPFVDAVKVIKMSTITSNKAAIDCLSWVWIIHAGNTGLLMSISANSTIFDHSFKSPFGNCIKLHQSERCCNAVHE